MTSPYLQNLCKLAPHKIFQESELHLAGRFFSDKEAKPSKIMISKSFRGFQFEIIIYQYFYPNVAYEYYIHRIGTYPQKQKYVCLYRCGVKGKAMSILE